MKKLPSKLTKEPLVDATFELRFKSTTQASTLLPGMLISKLSSPGDGIQVERMPAADMPIQIRESEPALRFAPLVKFTLGNFIIMIGDHSLAIGCVMPYQGWTTYKAMIKSVVMALQDAWYIQEVERHSIKYVDLIETDSLVEQVKAVAINLSIKNYHLTQENFQVRVEIPEGDHIKIIQLLTGAVLQGGHQRSGAVIDVDIVRNLSLSFEDYIKNLDTTLEDLHTLNKAGFFSCLTEETLNSLGPIYD